MNDVNGAPPAKAGEHPRYEAPAIVWEEDLPQGPNLFSACGKIDGSGGPCGSYPKSS
jgi:hypothetical protein